MTLQQFIDCDQFVRCYCIGQQEVMIMPYDPRKPYLAGEQYIHDPNYLEPKLFERVTKDVRTLNTALGYDLNTVEFAIKDGVPYAIDFMNPAPDAELISVGEFYHNWVTNAVTDLVFKRLAEGHPRSQYRWDAFLNPAPIRSEAVASAAEQTQRTVVPAPTESNMKGKAKAAAGNPNENLRGTTSTDAALTGHVNTRNSQRAKPDSTSKEVGERKTRGRSSSRTKPIS